LDYTENRTTPPTVPYIKSILKVVADMTKSNMKKTIDIAKGFYKRLRFIGLSADCWTNKKGKGFIGIEISFIYFDTVTEKFVKIVILVVILVVVLVIVVIVVIVVVVPFQGWAWGAATGRVPASQPPLRSRECIGARTEGIAS